MKNSDLDLKGKEEKNYMYMYANANLLLKKFSCCSVSVKCYLFMEYCASMFNSIQFNSLFQTKVHTHVHNIQNKIQCPFTIKY